ERKLLQQDLLGLKEGEVIQHSMVTASIERAQKKVEENNFGIRKRLLEYDDVMNSQRSVIYKRRHNALFGERLKLDVLNMFHDVVSGLVNEYQPVGDFEGFQFELFRRFAAESPVDEEGFKRMKTDELIDRVYDGVMATYDRHMARVATQAMPVITDVYLNQGAQYENIVVPITDGIKTMQVVANLQRCYKSEGRELVSSVEKYIALAIIDNEWKEHLREMDDLRRSVQNATYEQKDPLLIYKLESFNLFKAMIERMNGEVIGFLARAGLPSAQPQVQQAQAPRAPQQRLQTSRTETPQFSGGSRTSAPRPAGGGAPPARGPMPPQGPPQPVAPVRVEKKAGRNDPCPCGSGKKFKQCHGKDA
ncbi:MAG TPA: SEC-C metal-binding domain-containing protein, partial [Flavobacteriales bacterium]|nr:SEC-C metal-binding domain-containing protein [Flavobacteriales bacterium]